MCDKDSHFRTLDGVCNNIKHPLLGAANTTYARFIDPQYSGESYAPRVAISGNPLPNARNISFQVFVEEHKPSKKLANFAVAWGQFLAHDMTEAAAPAHVDCPACNVDGTDCFGIKIPDDDPFFVSKNVTCINVTRTLAVVGMDSMDSINTRQQLNEKTSFIDGSPVYGVDNMTLDGLRSKTAGRMKENLNPNGRNFKGLLPPENATENYCNSDNPKKGIYCFKAGDDRAIINSGRLLTLQNILLER